MNEFVTRKKHNENKEKYELPKNATSADIFFYAEQFATQDEGGDKVREENQKYASKLPYKPSLFELQAAQMEAEARREKAGLKKQQEDERSF